MPPGQVQQGFIHPHPATSSPIGIVPQSLTNHPIALVNVLANEGGVQDVAVRKQQNEPAPCISLHAQRFQLADIDGLCARRLGLS